jgi:ABC-type Fe3+/spermidine/putrescine transport system ATPase subunit
VQAGDAVTVIVRPEMIRFGAAGAGRGLAWKGVVRQRIFHGARNVYVVEVGGLRLTVDAAPDQTVSPDATVTLCVDHAHTWAARD